mmetsp:Transcript_19025/g.62560  ORF Transcript_19025/g.62560 Transcript_19025/m.62560 type:complete len:1014 (-) Transcript_19025:1090-4131(-)
MRGFGRRTFDVIEAARSGTAAEVEEAIHLGADISGSDEHGMTALHHASARGNLPIVSLLVKYGADLDVQDATGMVPLHSAVVHDRVQVAARLMLAGCSVDETDLRGYTPLHIAASNGHTTLVRLLVELGGASLQTKTKLMLTPLLCSVEKKRLTTIRYLADMQSPAFLLPAESSDFSPGNGRLSHRLSRFLKTLPPRPAQAIEEELNVRIALGPREEREAMEINFEEGFNLEEMRRERGCNVEARKQVVEEEGVREGEEEEEESLQRVLAYEDDETNRSETWVSRRKSASMITAWVRRKLVLDANFRSGLAERLRGICRGRKTLQRMIMAWRGRRSFEDERTAICVLQSVSRRRTARSSWNYLYRSKCATVISAHLLRRAKLSSFSCFLLKLRACREIIGPGMKRLLVDEEKRRRERARMVLAGVVRRTEARRSFIPLLQEREEAKRQLQRVLLAASERRRLLRTRLAAEEISRHLRRFSLRSSLLLLCTCATRLQAVMRMRLAAHDYSMQQGEAGMERCSLLRRRRKAAQQTPKWKAVRAAEEEAEWQGEEGRRVECLWLPFFASDDPREEDEAQREAGASSSTPAQAGHRGESQQEAGGGEMLGGSWGRPVSRGRLTSSRGQRHRPSTNGRSRHCEDATIREIAHRWSEAAENFALIEEVDLASALLDNLIASNARSFSEGMKCWLAHCVARRAVRPPAGPLPPPPLSPAPRSPQPQEVKSAIDKLWSFIDEDARTGDSSIDFGGISGRQRICCQLHVGYLHAQLGNFSMALKLFTAARQTLSGVRKGSSSLPSPCSWPCLLSLPPGSVELTSPKQGADEEKACSSASSSSSSSSSTVDSLFSCSPELVLSIAQVNCAVCMLKLGALEQALQQAEAAWKSFASRGTQSQVPLLLLLLLPASVEREESFHRDGGDQEDLCGRLAGLGAGSESLRRRREGDGEERACSAGQQRHGLRGQEEDHSPVQGHERSRPPCSQKHQLQGRHELGAGSPPAGGPAGGDGDPRRGPPDTS